MKEITEVIKYPCLDCPLSYKCAKQNPADKKTGQDCKEFTAYVEQDILIRTINRQRKTRSDKGSKNTFENVNRWWNRGLGVIE